ncbi:MAG: RimJ/RimL family protein N-acetyltransferase [Granulosicoccus sp.]|jgi:RimJ/RimL family protein N-acetyltransferase
MFDLFLTFALTMEQPTLTTSRLILRALEDSDSKAIYRNFSHPDMVKYYDLDLFTEESQATTLIHNWIKLEMQVVEFDGLSVCKILMN